MIGVIMHLMMARRFPNCVVRMKAVAVLSLNCEREFMCFDCGVDYARTQTKMSTELNAAEPLTICATQTSNDP
jgi:hypothetical protein